jgi:mannitol 2-dehydrogenase
LRDALVSGGKFHGLALVSAMWCRYCAGTTDSGAEIMPNDPDWTKLTQRAAQARENPEVWLGLTSVYGDLGDDPRFAAAFADWLNALWADGTSAVLSRYIAS